jgi:hypothetical protein
MRFEQVEGFDLPDGADRSRRERQRSPDLTTHFVEEGDRRWKELAGHGCG